MKSSWAGLGIRTSTDIITCLPPEVRDMRSLGREVEVIVVYNKHILNQIKSIDTRYLCTSGPLDMLQARVVATTTCKQSKIVIWQYALASATSSFVEWPLTLISIHYPCTDSFILALGVENAFLVNLCVDSGKPLCFAVNLDGMILLTSSCTRNINQVVYQ